MSKVAISSGHGLHIRGAAGSPIPPCCDEVDEARKIVDRVYELLNDGGIPTVKFHDDVSKSQSENLDRLVDWHNAQTRTYDVSVHLNCYDGNAHGTEVLYVTQDDLAATVSMAIAEAGGFTNRGPKYNGGLAFLNGTEEPSILLEVFFCDNESDCDKYRKNFEAICGAIASSIGGEDYDDNDDELPGIPPRPVKPPAGARVDIRTTGTVAVTVNGKPV